MLFGVYFCTHFGKVMVLLTERKERLKTQETTEKWSLGYHTSHYVRGMLTSAPDPLRTF